MEPTGNTLPQRVIAVLRTRQYVVFFAIGLYALDVAVPILSAWLHRGARLDELLRNTWGALADAVATGSVTIIALFIVFVLVKTWLRAGYIRSLIGPFHPGAADWRQFARLLGFQLLLEALAAATVGAAVLAGGRLDVAGLIVLAVLLVYLSVIYADYIVILAGVGPLRAIRLSWRTVRAAFLPSVLVLLAVTLLGEATSSLVGDSAAGGLAEAAPMLLVQCAVMGVVLFVADVTLVTIYLDAAEHGRLRSGGRVSPSSRD